MNKKYSIQEIMTYDNGIVLSFGCSGSVAFADMRTGNYWKPDKFDVFLQRSSD